MQFAVPLKGRPKLPSDHQIGSLRDVAKSVDMVPGHHVAGERLRELFLLYFKDKPKLAGTCCKALSTKTPISDLFPTEDLVNFDNRQCNLLDRTCRAPQRRMDLHRPVSKPTCCI